MQFVGMGIYTFFIQNHVCVWSVSVHLGNNIPSKLHSKNSTLCAKIDSRIKFVSTSTFDYYIIFLDYSYVL